VKEMNLSEAARHIGVTDKTVRQWIEAGKFPGAIFNNKKGRGVWYIPLAEAEAIRQIIQDDASIDTTDTLASLALQIRLLEDRIRLLEEKIVLTSDSIVSIGSIHTTGTLPNGYIPLASFFHGVSESSVRRWRNGASDRASVGLWYDEKGHIVNIALSPKQQALFYKDMHERVSFRACPDCPHEQ
jgi:transposase-like protein